MRKTALLLFVLLLAVPGFSQVTFSPVTVAFPHIDVGGDPAGLNYVTIIQVVNNTSSFSIGHVTLYSDSGTALSASFDGGSPQSSLDFTLDSGTTRQIQVSLNNPTITAGWMQITYNPAECQTTVILQL